MMIFPCQELRHLRAPVKAELTENSRYVGPQRGFGDPKLSADFSVIKACYNQISHFRFPGGQTQIPGNLRKSKRSHLPGSVASPNQGIDETWSHRVDNSCVPRGEVLPAGSAPDPKIADIVTSVEGEIVQAEAQAVLLQEVIEELGSNQSVMPHYLADQCRPTPPLQGWRYRIMELIIGLVAVEVAFRHVDLNA